MNKTSLKLVLLATSLLLLAACQPHSESEQQAPAFERPKDQYGLPYWAGNLGGKPVKLPSTIFIVWEYNDSPDTWGGTKEERLEYEKHPRTYDSIIKSMAFEMRYSDGMLLEGYYKAPQTSKIQYQAEHDRPDSKWLSVGIESGKRYGGGSMDITWDNIMSAPKNSSTAYHPTGKEIYGLQEYKLDNPSRHGMNRDLYVYKDENGNVITIMYCHSNKFGGGCEQRFLFLPELKARARAIVIYKRVNLKDWQLIQTRVREALQPYILDKKPQ
ncbi:hypothetical protein SAMN05421749_10240 [Acinetobacter marinus]|uniref:Lipoprotein n=1 Tax=Acinetobacter marinus TaxID=281375 RepID=A0A1G6HD71_9GAMM|nr:hypothetical protein [Acinetobacter marinus]SDB91376.1 hypothetical protein SAMN05421749_10240 [Acinetobacter marinus]